MLNEKIAFRPEYDIYYTLNNVINSGTHKILDLLTDLSLAKAYYFTIQPDQHVCECYYCNLHHMLRKTLFERGTSQEKGLAVLLL